MADIDFLKGGGTMGALIRAYDWNASILGPPQQWPAGLKTSVRLLLSTGHPMVLWWGPELIQFYNDAYSRSIGPERHPSALGQRGRECWGEIWPIIGPQIEKVMTGQGFTWYENQLVPITRHGKREDVYWTYSYGPIHEAQAPNGIGGVLVVCTETTDQVVAEKRMQAAEARWRELFEQTPGFKAILNGPEHVFEFANRQYRDLVGGREIIGKRVRDALPEVVSQGFVELLDQVFETGEPHFGTASPIVLEHGPRAHDERVFLDFVYQPVRNSEGDVTGIFVSGYDVTERVVTGESLRDEQLRKDEFLAMLGHELRNPLSAIQNASELLSRNADSDAPTRAVGDLLGRQVTQLRRLVDDLLDVSRISKGRIELKHEVFDLGEAVGLAIEIAQPLLDSRRHEFTKDLCDERLYVKGDRARVVQSIANVLTNAAKYTEPGGSVRLAVRPQGERGVIEVSDNGVGIPADLLPKVFDLFVQADRAADRSQGGLGIGLSIVRRLLELHGGDVSAHSDGDGRGATFRLRLPLTSMPAMPKPDAGRAAASSKALRVLVVDDNVDSADSLAELLRCAGYCAEAAHGAREALDKSAELETEIVLLDIGLPDMDGYEVARRLRDRQGKIRILALTGYGQARDVERALRGGFDAHMTKPVAFDELQRLLANLS